MAGREVKIHRGRLDKKILADRAQLLQKKNQNIFLKILKMFENIFIFLDGKFVFFEKSQLFSFRSFENDSRFLIRK